MKPWIKLKHCISLGFILYIVSLAEKTVILLPDIGKLMYQITQSIGFSDGKLKFHFY